MRTGAIFERGSCRALKWMALLGVTFALGVGEAAAQAVDPTLTVTASSVVEENGNRLPVTVRLSVPRSSPARTADQTVTVTLTVTHLGGSGQSTISASRRAEFPAIDVIDGDDMAWRGGTAGNNALELTFSVDPGAFSDERTVYLDINEDDDAEDEHFYIDGSSAEVAGVIDAASISRHVAVKIDDDETQNYVLLPDNHPIGQRTIKEGENLQMLLEARPPRTTDYDFRVELSSAEQDSDYGFGGTDSNTELVTLPGRRDPDTPSTERTGEVVAGEMTLMLSSRSDNDRDRVDDTVTITVEDSATGETSVTEPLVITVVDQHKLPSISRADDIEVTVGTTKSMVAMLMEGQKGTVTLVADRTGDGVPDSEDIEVELSLGEGGTANAQDYRLDSSKVELDDDDTSGTFVLDVLEDEEVGDETLVLMATVSGEDGFGKETMTVMLDAITLTDATMKKIEPKSYDDVKDALAAARAEGAGANGMWNPGETMTLEASDMFMWPETTTSVVLGNVVVDDTSVLSATTSNDMLTLTAMGPGETPVSVTATVVSESSSFEVSQTVSNVATIKFPVMVDAYAITAMSDAGVQAAFDAAIAEAAAGNSRMAWEPGGEVAMVALDQLFDVPESIMASYLAESSDSDDVMAEIYGDHVALTPMSAGMAEISVTAVDAAEGMATTVTATAMVMAVDPAAITYTLSGPEDMNLAEGMSAMVTVMASDPVPMDTEVMIMRDRSASSADDDDYMAEPVTIMAGGTSGSTMVMAVEDNMAEDMEELVLFAMAGDSMVEGEVKLYLWDAAVPALPIIAQFLLGGLLALGEFRRYRRRS